VRLREYHIKVVDKFLTQERVTVCPSHSQGDKSEVLRSVARSMAVDLKSAEALTALSKASIRAILLKGPSFARWLYEDENLRTYRDSDLLVAPDNVEAAVAVLAALGFEDRSRATPHGRPLHARPLIRDQDGASIDLHESLIGVDVTSSQLWKTLSGRTEVMQVSGQKVEVLDPAARAFHLALHAAYDGPRMQTPLMDLSKAIDRLSDDVWHAASVLATELRAAPAFAAGLRTLPEGFALAERLNLTEKQSPRIALSASYAPPLSLGFLRLEELSTVREKGAFIWHKVFPPVAFMRASQPLARQGRLGLAAAYVSRPLWLLKRAGPGFLAWWRAKER
jgi:Uncharacterised nucleotidyltransferase